MALPSAAYALLLGGPLSSTVCVGCLAGREDTSTDRRRGVADTVMEEEEEEGEEGDGSRLRRERREVMEDWS